MNVTGIARKVDELGRIVLPVELRRSLKIKEGTPLEIGVDEAGRIILKKSEDKLPEVLGELRKVLEQSKELMEDYAVRENLLGLERAIKKHGGTENEK